MASFQPIPWIQASDDAGAPLAGGKIWTYISGTTTPKATYTDAALITPNTNPIILNARGEAQMVLGAGAYSLKLLRADDTLVKTIDGVTDAATLASSGDALIRSDLAASTGAGLMGWIRNATGAVVTTLLKWLGWQTPSVFEFMTDAQIADVQAGVFNAGVILAIDAAVLHSSRVFMPPGTYKIQRAIKLSRQRQILQGGGCGLTSIVAQPGFASETVGGSTGSALIWYQAPGLWTDASWVVGGSISDMTLNANMQGVEGIRVNRVTNGQEFKSLRVLDATIGINGTKWGWLTKFDNVTVEQSTVAGIRLSNGYNGCTFINTLLYGGSISTPVLLDMSIDCYGNSFTGGAIEGGDIGARLNNAQIAIHGTDFEVITQKFIEIYGLYSIPPYGGVLNIANPTCAVTGCTFVGLPSVAGIMVTGGSADVRGNFAINSGAAPAAGVYFLNGVDGGDITATGFEQPCIAESDNVIRGWGNKLATGKVVSRFTRITTAGVTFPTPALPSTSPTTLDDYREGAFTPSMAGTGWGAGMTASGVYTKIGNLVSFVIMITGATNSSVRTTSFLTLPTGIVGVGAANVTDSYNTAYGPTAVVTGGSLAQVYMPLIASTAATLIVSGSYFTA